MLLLLLFTLRTLQWISLYNWPVMLVTKHTKVVQTRRCLPNLRMKTSSTFFYTLASSVTHVVNTNKRSIRYICIWGHHITHMICSYQVTSHRLACKVLISESTCYCTRLAFSHWNCKSMSTLFSNTQGTLHGKELSLSGRIIMFHKSHIAFNYPDTLPIWYSLF